MAKDIRSDSYYTSTWSDVPTLDEIIILISDRRDRGHKDGHCVIQALEQLGEFDLVEEYIEHILFHSYVYGDIVQWYLLRCKTVKARPHLKDKLAQRHCEVHLEKGMYFLGVYGAGVLEFSYHDKNSLRVYNVYPSLLEDNQWIGIETTKDHLMGRSLDFDMIRSTLPQYPSYPNGEDKSRNVSVIEYDPKGFVRSFGYRNDFGSGDSSYRNTETFKVVDKNGKQISLWDLKERFQLTSIKAPYGEILLENGHMVGCPMSYKNSYSGQQQGIMLSISFLQKHRLYAVIESVETVHSGEGLRFQTNFHRRVYPNSLTVKGEHRRSVADWGHKMVTLEAMVPSRGYLLYREVDTGKLIFDHRKFLPPNALLSDCEFYGAEHALVLLCESFAPDEHNKLRTYALKRLGQYRDTGDVYGFNETLEALTGRRYFPLSQIYGDEVIFEERVRYCDSDLYDINVKSLRDTSYFVLMGITVLS